MNNLIVNTKNIQKNSERMKKYSQSIVASEKRLSEIASNIKVPDNEAQVVKKYLDNICKNLLEEASKMNTLSEAIIYIANMYETAEKEIIGADTCPEDSDYNTNTGNKLDNFFNEIINDIKDWLMEHGRKLR